MINSAAVIPLNFNAFTGEVFNVKEQGITVAPTTGGFLLKTDVGFGIIPTQYFEPVLFDNNDWHVASKITQSGDTGFSFLFEPDLFGPNPVTAIGGTQAGLMMADAAAAVPIPPSVLLCGSGLLGMTAVARRKTKETHGFAA